MVKGKDRSEIKQKARSVRSRMRQLDQMIKGSIMLRKIKCGKRTCKCFKGKPHTCLCITYKENRKTKTIYIDKSRRAEVLMMCANYKKMKSLLKELTRLNLELVKSQRKKKSGNK